MYNLSLAILLIVKRIEDTCFIIQARLSSERVPCKMIKPFADSNLVDIACKKVLRSEFIPRENFFFSAYDKEIIDIVNSNKLQVFYRSKESALAEGPINLIMEFYKELNFKYFILISACYPLLKISTIDLFISRYLKSKNQGLFSVIKKKNYFWDSNQNMITEWPNGLTCFNTKKVGITYEAAHCLYAGRMDLLADNIIMAEPPFKKDSPELFEIPEEESFDVDYDWQFKYIEKIYSQIG